MGKYDYVDQRYFLTPERMADLLSVGVYHKRFRIGAEDLEKVDGDYQTLGAAFGRLQRDGLFWSKKHGIKYGVEIESYADYSMPRRIMTYDACEYERQAEKIHRSNHQYKNFEEKKSKMRRDDVYIPVVNVVLYLGKKHWRGCNTLRDLFHLSGDALKYNHDKVQNYTFAVIEAECVNPEDYRTDLRLFFKAMQCRENKKKLDALFESEEYKNLEWSAQCAIAVHLNIKRLITKVVEEEENMCKAYRELVEDWKLEGKLEGKAEERIHAIKGLLKMGMQKEIIMQLEYTEEEYEQAMFSFS